MNPSFWNNSSRDSAIPLAKRGLPLNCCTASEAVRVRSFPFCTLAGPYLRTRSSSINIIICTISVGCPLSFVTARMLASKKDSSFPRITFSISTPFPLMIAAAPIVLPGVIQISSQAIEIIAPALIASSSIKAYEGTSKSRSSFTIKSLVSKAKPPGVSSSKITALAPSSLTRASVRCQNLKDCLFTRAFSPISSTTTLSA